MRLQYQLCNGTWIECGDRQREFLDRCFAAAAGSTVGVLDALAAGQIVRYGGSEWHANCRDGDVPRPAKTYRGESEFLVGMGSEPPELT